VAAYLELKNAAGRLARCGDASAREDPMESESTIKIVAVPAGPPAAPAPAAHSLAPVPKVAASGVAGACTTIAVWLLQQVTGVVMPPEVVAALTTLLMFGTGYMVKGDTPAPVA
jgi:hypothetical protein